MGKRPLRRARFWLRYVLLPFLFFVGDIVHAQEEVCAVVKIEILQELTLERQAFEASMRITNSLDTLPLENVKVEVDFRDENGELVTATSDPNGDESAKFFFRVDYLDGVDDVSGSGTIAESTTAEATWLIIPTAGAADGDPEGALYFVGAKLTYLVGGKAEEVIVAPDSIVVKPQPRLTLDYFLTRDIYGDDAFTSDVVEPPVPYTLGVRISNNGSGAAPNVRIDSAQPRIVENEQGLAVGFRILGSFVDNAPAEPTLLVDFGEIAANGIRTGRWIMETTLSGTFVEFDAHVSHADELGGQLTSLIEAANTHLLLRDVLVDLPGRDLLRDFLALDGPLLHVYESERNGIAGDTCTDCLAVNDVSGTSQLGAGTPYGSGFAHSLVVPASGLPVYLKIPDPHGGEFAIGRVLRSDGKVLNEANAWLSRERAAADPTEFEHFINLFDTLTTGTYTVEFVDGAAGPQPPVIQFIPDRTTYEGGQVGFIVRASDPNDDPVQLHIEHRPEGAEFVDKGEGQGVFSWFPQVGQAGTYSVDFVATDGLGTTRLSVKIRINPADDRDGDGMDDAWELEHFGNLDRDGTGDFDGDGYTDLQEFNNDTDPKVIEAVPEVPVIAAPVDGAEVSASGVAFRIDTSNQPDTRLITLRLEVYGDEGLTSLIGMRADIPINALETTVDAASVLPDGVTFEENRHYFWRVRAESPTGSSEWEEANFFFNTMNEAPAGLSADSPAEGEMVASLAPEFRFRNATDVDGDAIVHDLRVFEEGDENEPVIAIDGVIGDPSGVTRVQSGQSLLEDRGYYWFVTARDEHGLEFTTGHTSFFVSTENHPPAAPLALTPLDLAEVDVIAPLLTSSSATDPERQPVTYRLEVSLDRQFTAESLVHVHEQAVMADAVEWQLPALTDNTEYFWRVRASDGEAHSAWTDAAFFINTANDAPYPPVITNPGADAWVEVVQPVLSVAPATDVDRDVLRYEFQLFADSERAIPITAGISSRNEWQIDVPLPDNRYYYWRARAVDEHGLAGGWTETSRFFVNKDGFDDPPAFDFILPDEDIFTLGGHVRIQWRDTDPDSDARIMLYANGQPLLPQPVSEDGDGEADYFDWSLASLPPGEYRLSASISDDTTATNANACCRVVILPATVGFKVEQVSGVGTEETGSDEVIFSVQPDSMPFPGTSVTVNFAVEGDEAELVADTSHFLFDMQNWMVPQQIRVRGLDDCEIDGDQEVQLRFAAATSDDQRFHGVYPPAQTFVNQDNESAGQTLFICNYETLATTSLGGGRVELELKARLKNTGEPRSGVTASGQIVSGSQSLDGAGLLTFPDVFASSTVSSQQAFRLEINADEGVDFAKLAWDIQPGTVIEFREGTEGRDRLRGTGDSDHLDGGAGNDNIKGRRGDDVIIGGAGSDRMHGDKGDDLFLVAGNQPGVDTFNGGSGYDTIRGSDIDDTVVMTHFVGANRVEEIDGGAGSNRILGTPGSDNFDFSDTLLRNIDYIDLLAGDDRLLGSLAKDIIIGGAGDDELRGGAGDDIFLYSGNEPGIDRISGEAGQDLVLGSDGSDIIRFDHYRDGWSVERIDGRAGHDVIGGGDDDTTLDFSGTRLENIELIAGGSGNDVIIATASADAVNPGGGIDHVELGNGDDRLLLDGESGLGDYQGGGGHDAVVGTIEDDTIRFSRFGPANSFEVIDGGGGFNVVGGTALPDVIDLSGTSLVSIQRIEAGLGPDRVTGSNLMDEIAGGAGIDVLDGAGGADSYHYSPGDGHDFIDDSGPAGEKDVIRLGEGIDADHVRIFEFAGKLRAILTGHAPGSGFSILAMPDGSWSVEEIRFADGSVIILNDVQMHAAGKLSGRLLEIFEQEEK